MAKDFFDEHVTKDFKWGEFFVTGQNQARLRADFLALPDDKRNELIRNLTTLANRLQVIRDKLGPITITSGYRDPRVNAAVGGKPKSYHLRGMAADITVANMTPKQVQLALADWQGGMGLAKTFTHLDTRAVKCRFKY